MFGKNTSLLLSKSRKRGIDLMKDARIGRRIVAISANLRNGKIVIVKIDGKYHKLRELGAEVCK